MSQPIQIYQAATPTDADALIHFLTSLLPTGLPLIQRLSSPTHTSNAVILSTFPPSNPPSTDQQSETPCTIAFLDRATPDCLFMFLFSSIEVSPPSPKSSPKDNIALKQILVFLKHCHDIGRPEGITDSDEAFVNATPTAMFPRGKDEDITLAGAVNARVADLLRAADEGEPERVIRDDIRGKGGPYWKLAWRCSPRLASISLPQDDEDPLPEGLHWDHVQTDEEVAEVMRTNSLVRVRSQVDGRHHVAIRDMPTNKLVGWVYMGLEGSVRTLHVQPEFRGRGLAKKLVTRLTQRVEGEQQWRIGSGERVGPRAAGEWQHTDVAESNAESRGLFEKHFDAQKVQESYWIRLDLAAAARRGERDGSAR